MFCMYTTIRQSNQPSSLYYFCLLFPLAVGVRRSSCLAESLVDTIAYLDAIYLVSTTVDAAPLITLPLQHMYVQV